MDYESRLSISYYREIAAINQEHHIFLVQHIESHKFFVKKVLDVYNMDIYRKLKDFPVKGIPQIYELCEEDGRLTVIEEYISGQTLDEYIKTHGPLTETQAADYIVQLCDTLSTLHKMTPSVIHRDIKPSNVMITPFEHIVLLDFNAAKYMNISKTEDTVLLGTHGYAAPEQYGFGSSNIQTDIYATGILLNIMLTGELPSNKEAAGPFASVISKSTQLRPNDRYPSIDALKSAILRVHPNRKQESLDCKKYYGSFLPPGFRSKNVFHMLLGTFGYGMILWIGTTLIVENVSPQILLFERIIFTLSVLLMVFFSCNYRNIHSFFPFCSSQKKPVKMLAVVFFNFLIFMTMILLMSLVEAFVM